MSVASSPPLDTLDDAALLRAHVSGVPQAFATLAARHRHRLWAVAFRTLDDRQDAEDAVQEALIKAHRAAPSFRGDAAVSTWLHRIVVNVALDQVRRRRIVTVGDETAVERVPARDAIGAAQARIDVQRALQALPQEQRLAIILTDIEGMSSQEAADALKIPVGTLKSRNARGKAAMRAFLSGSAPTGNQAGEARVPHPGSTRSERGRGRKGGEQP